MTELIHRTLPSMHSTLDILLTGISDDVAETLISSIQKESLTMEMLLSCFDPSSETWWVNIKAKEVPVPLSESLWSVLTECFQFHGQTRGLFDVGLKACKTREEVLHDPRNIGMKTIILDERFHTVKFESSQSGFDFGAIGKGLLLRQIDKILDGFEVKNGFISFGGSSILTRGHHPHGGSWPIGLRSALGDLPIFYMNNHSASFSRTFPEGTDDCVGHIINPLSGMPVKTNRLAAILCECPVKAEVLSTAFIAAPFEDAKTMAENFKPSRAYLYEYDDTILKRAFRYDP